MQHLLHKGSPGVQLIIAIRDEEIINSNREIIIKKLSEAVRINIKSAKKVYEHVLINEYDLADGHHSVYSFYV